MEWPVLAWVQVAANQQSRSGQQEASHPETVWARLRKQQKHALITFCRIGPQVRHSKHLCSLHTGLRLVGTASDASSAVRRGARMSVGATVPLFTDVSTRSCSRSRQCTAE